MTGTFILSLDCEGKWGVADHLRPEHEHTLSDTRLKNAYRSIVDLLDRYEIPATFAFVGAFTWSRETADLDGLRQFAAQAPWYLDPALADLEQGEGWFGEWAVEMIDNVHEIALHGATHVPWGMIDEQTARAELALLKTMPRVVSARTYVFPRNQVNHEHLLAHEGIAGWREHRDVSRARHILSEFNLFSLPDKPGRSIPAGRYLNWPHGFRKLVPPAMSQLRARHMLARAAETQGVVHYWTHPENVASEPATLDVLERVLKEVKAARSRGLIRTHRQVDYVAANGVALSAKE